MLVHPPTIWPPHLLVHKPMWRRPLRNPAAPSHRHPAQPQPVFNLHPGCHHNRRRRQHPEPQPRWRQPFQIKRVGVEVKNRLRPARQPLLAVEYENHCVTALLPSALTSALNHRAGVPADTAATPVPPPVPTAPPRAASCIPAWLAPRRWVRWRQSRVRTALRTPAPDCRPAAA